MGRQLHTSKENEERTHTVELIRILLKVLHSSTTRTDSANIGTFRI
jgi:hypothetical protein